MARARICVESKGNSIEISVPSLCSANQEADRDEILHGAQ
jgi:hypothetical protein